MSSAQLFSLQGKVALVTGGATGIGRFYTAALAGAGAQVAAADINSEAVAAAEVELGRQFPGQVMGIEVDVGIRQRVRDMVAAVEQRWGHLDILVNNAGLLAALPQREAFWEIPDEEWDRVMAVNVRSMFFCVTEALPLMRRNNWGRIINIASGLAFKGNPILMHYAASKSAVVGLTRSMATALGPMGINVNAIAPGGTASPTLMAARPGMDRNATVGQRIIKRVEVPEDLIGTLLYLASPASDFVTGQTVAVDGGSVLH